MKILGIVGTNVTNSVGRKPSVERMADTCFERLAAAGNDAEQVVLSGYQIDYCDHCEICDHEENCSLRDDFWQIYEKIKAADAVIFFTTVTYGMMNPKLAALLQRAGRIARSNGRQFAGKISGLLTEEVRTTGEPVLEQFNLWCQSEGMQLPIVARVSFGSTADGKHAPMSEIEPVRQAKARDLAEAFLKKSA